MLDKNENSYGSKTGLVCDLTVVKLGKKLRILGYDVEIVKSSDTTTIEKVIKTNQINKTLITKSRKLARKLSGILVLSNNVSKQIEEVMSKLQGITRGNPRCSECNAELIECSKENVAGKVPTYVFESFEHFKCCPKCGKVFWEGSHFQLRGIWNLADLKDFKLRRGEPK
ncbi:Mut7-C RNAse domain-containing protein [Fervidobacterium gondwanense]|uniref:Mut7-C RNAse domain-containing protein n=1 Tax=Fervidobacterium gondwanense TaxID=44754 RepID=UPI003C794D4E